VNFAPRLGVHDVNATPISAHPDVVPPDTEAGASGVGVGSYADWNLDLCVRA
jgi:hypothetical protein